MLFKVSQATNKTDSQGEGERQMAALSLSRCVLHKNPSARLDGDPIASRHVSSLSPPQQQGRRKRWWGAAAAALPPRRRRPGLRASAGSRADDSSSAPFEMSVESALKLLGVSEGASFDEILRAKNATVASCKDNQEAIAQVEAAYDMLLMQSLNQRRAGKVINSSIRYADVKPIRSSGTSSLPQWLQTTVKNVPVSIEAPSTRDLGIQAGVYGALMVFTFASGASTSSVGTYTGGDVPGIILATGFGVSLYFLTKKSSSLGKATLITVGGLVVGAVVGSAVEQWLQVDIFPFFGIHSPAVIDCYLKMDLVAREAKYECLLFDIGDTLYPMSTDLNLACYKNIQDYMLHHLKIKESNVPQMCVDLYKEYGTTMAGLKTLAPLQVRFADSDRECHADLCSLWSR